MKFFCITAKVAIIIINKLTMTVLKIKIDNAFQFQ